MLKEGVKILTKNLKNVYISNGIRAVKILNGINCKEDTFVPNPPWRQPNSSEWKILTENASKTPYHDKVSVVDLPNSLIETIKETAINQAVNFKEYNCIVRSDKFIKAKELIIEWSKKFLINETTPQIVNIGAFKSGLETITYNYNRNFYIGLHLDSWDKLKIENLKTASNRICINLGKEKRSFLFLNLPVYDVLSSAKHSINPHYAIKDFLRNNPTYPIIKIDLYPFQGYIAPTENIIHDGSSMQQKFIDINLSIRSYFCNF